MIRQSVIRVLLSLLLLASQQMATAHAMSHWSGTLDGAAQVHQSGDEQDLSSAFAQDQTCNQCLAFAQLAGPLGSDSISFAAPELESVAVPGTSVHDCSSRAILAFQSRAPPQA